MSPRRFTLAAFAVAALASPALAQSPPPSLGGLAGRIVIPVELEIDPLGPVAPVAPVAPSRPSPAFDPMSLYAAESWAMEEGTDEGIDMLEPGDPMDPPDLLMPMPEPPPAPEPAIARDPAELIVNGGFEAPYLAAGSWDVFDAVAGWQTSSGPGIEIQHGVAGAPFAGGQHVELDSHGSSAMFQVLPTIPGATYLVTYRASPRPGTAADDNALEVRWNGAPIDRYLADRAVGATTWELRAVMVVARSRETRLELADISPSNSLGAYVDDVSVRLVGQPPRAPTPPRPRFAVPPR